jgi:hypothetical protein
MSKRARYDGPSEVGVSLNVPLADGQTVPIQVERGHLLPEELDGQRVPAAFRDSLLEQKANWSAVDQASGGTTAPKNDKNADDKKEG